MTSALLLRSLLSDLDRTGAGAGPSMDWRETPEAHVFTFDVPGLTKDDVKVQVHDDRVLHVISSGGGAEEVEDEKECKWHCRERVGRREGFRRVFRLPDDAKVDEIEARVREGVLVVRVGKDSSKKKRKHGRNHKRRVEISGGGEGKDSGGAKGLTRFVCCKA